MKMHSAVTLALGLWAGSGAAYAARAPQEGQLIREGYSVSDLSKVLGNVNLSRPEQCVATTYVDDQGANRFTITKAGQRYEGIARGKGRLDSVYRGHHAAYRLTYTDAATADAAAHQTIEVVGDGDRKSILSVALITLDAQSRQVDPARSVSCDRRYYVSGPYQEGQVIQDDASLKDLQDTLANLDTSQLDDCEIDAQFAGTTAVNYSIKKIARVVRGRAIGKGIWTYTYLANHQLAYRLTYSDAENADAPASQTIELVTNPADDSIHQLSVTTYDLSTLNPRDGRFQAVPELSVQCGRFWSRGLVR